MPRIRALLDALSLLVLTLAAVGALSRSALSAWGISRFGRPFLEYALMAALPVAAILLRRRSLAAYGLSVSGGSVQLRIALTCMISYAVFCLEKGLARTAPPRRLA